MDRSSRQKINKETQALNDKTEEIDLIDIYDIPSKNSRLHFLLKYAWNILQDRSHLGSQIKPQWMQENWNHIKHLYRPQHYEVRNEIQGKKNIKNTNTWRLNNTLLNNQETTEEIKEEIKEGIKKYRETNDNENMAIQNLWDSAKAVLIGKFMAIQAYL